MNDFLLFDDRYDCETIVEKYITKVGANVSLRLGKSVQEKVNWLLMGIKNG